MYQLFARNVFNDERVANSEDIFIEIRFAELYQDKFYDLLSGEKRECFLRESQKGEVQIRAAPVKCDDGKIRAYPIGSVHVRTEKELLAVIADGISSRNVGNSTLHDKSSRSHAFLEFEIVNTELVNARKELIEVQADITLTQLMMDTPSMSALIKRHGGRELVIFFLFFEARMYIESVDMI